MIALKRKTYLEAKFFLPLLNQLMRSGRASEELRSTDCSPLDYCTREPAALGDNKLCLTLHAESL